MKLPLPRFAPSFALPLALLAAACTDRPGAANGDQDTGGTLIIALPGTGVSPTFPLFAADNMARMISDQLFDRLAEIGPELGTVGDRGFTPRLAHRWEWARDSMSIAFHLDPRAHWHDGRPIRASDLRFTFDLMKDPKTATQLTPLVANIDSISVRDSLTAVAWFRARSPQQFYDAAYQIFVVPEHLLKDIPRDQLANSEAVQRPVGSGPFRFARSEPGVRIELLADTSHYRGRPNLDRVVLSFTGDANNGITQLMAGQADLFDAVPADVVPRLDSADHLRTLRYQILGYGFMSMNLRDPARLGSPHPIFGDRAVRRALSMAVDRAAMVRNIFGPDVALSLGPYPNAIADSSVMPPPFDRSRAEALLDSAGWRRGADGIRAKNGRPLAFSITAPTSSPQRMRFAVLLQEQFRSVGAQTDIQNLEFNAVQERLEAGRFDATLYALGQDPPRTGITQFWTTSGLPPGGSNVGGYSSPAVDALVDSLAYTTDPERADDQWRRMSRIIIDDAPAIWLYAISPVLGVHRRIRIEGMRSDGWWHGLADWWIPAGERIERDRIGLRPAQP